jgi:hypothetical protein
MKLAAQVRSMREADQALIHSMGPVQIPTRLQLDTNTLHEGDTPNGGIVGPVL